MRSIVLLLLLFSVQKIAAQNVYKLEPHYPVHALDPYVQIYPDPKNELSASMLLRDSISEYLRGNELPRYLKVGTTYWAKLRLETTQNLEDWTLHLEDKMIGPPAWTKSNGKVDVFAYANGRLVFHRKTGVEYPVDERDLPEKWMLNRVSLDGLPTDTPVDILLKVQGNNLGYPAYFNLSIRDKDHQYYHEFNQFHSSFNWFLFGVTFIIFLYHFLLFLYLRQKVYFWYSLWLFFCTLTMAMTNGLMVDWFTDVRYIFWMLIANGVFYTFWFFGRSFVNSAEKFKTLDKIMLGLALLVFTEVLITAIYIYITKAQLYFTGLTFHYYTLFVYTLAGIIISIILAGKKDPFSRYFGIGTLVASIFLSIGTLWVLNIIVPPFRIDPFATGMFLQVVIYSIGIAYRQQILNLQIQKEKLEAQQTQAEITRIKEIDSLKTRFFTNISHEFRTPLTLIQGPLRQAKKSQITPGEDIRISENSLDMVERNMDRLQALIDELLELSKIESGKMQLLLSEANVMSYLKTLAYSFESMADRNNIEYHVNIVEGKNDDYFDKPKLEKIVLNLISNAFKYTGDPGKVEFEAFYEGDNLVIKVGDNGRGLKPGELQHIFDRFYRVEGSEAKGSGIGLALCKELVDLHGGDIITESEPGKGTTFVVRIPLVLDLLPQDAKFSEKRLKDSAKAKMPEISYSEEHFAAVNDGSNKILVVEDNEDLRIFIKSILAARYEVILAEDGAAGNAKAQEIIPDVIISDVMMPNMNGYELCSQLKTNDRTSHIPVILLTAKAGQKSKMEGLLQGADVYLSKPFDEQELLLRVQNLLKNRDRLWKKISNNKAILIDELELTSVDDHFFKKVTSVIQDHMDDDTFSVEHLAKEVGFSRSQLYRKIKGLLNKTPNQLISEIRLNKAFELLENNSCSVSEAAYSVGISNMSYFTKIFKEKFGKAPSKVQKTE